MLNPLQRLLFCVRHGPKPLPTLLIASGSSIYVFNTSDGNLLSSWSKLKGTSSASRPESRSNKEHHDSSGQEPAGKRRRLSSPKDETSEQGSPEIVTNDGSNNRQRPKNQRIEVSAVTNLCSTGDGKHIVAITGDDKCVRVLSLSEMGMLEQLSQRMMPKRPNTVTLTHDQATILCGDKFGDVYALPLIEELSSLSSDTVITEIAEGAEKPSNQPFVPTASSLTVHTKKNQAALRMQQKATSIKAPKQGPQFQHQLLLGHVSLLTDIVHIQIPVSGGLRNYILSSDRDEHIRVSRGIPQAHIIESYCLGHTQFVSRMCNPSWRPEVLISGGGDDYLLSWEWISGESKQKIEIKAAVDAARASSRPDSEEEISPARADIVVSGIWAMQTQDLEGQIIVACEGLPALLTYRLTRDGRLEYQQTVPTSHNVLDIAIDQANLRIIYSLDNVHKPWSTTELESERSNSLLGFQTFSLDSNSWIDECDSALSTGVNCQAKRHEPVDSTTEVGQLSSLFYNLGNLRKEGGRGHDEE